MAVKRPIRTASTFVLDHDPQCRCGNHATTFMELHRINDCATESTLGSFVCTPCLGDHVRRLSQLTMRAQLVGGLKCRTCDLVVVTTSDLIIRITPLDK